MTQTDADTPSPRVKCRILTVTVDGRSRHRILGLDLRHGQSLAPLDPDVRKKVEGIAARHGLDIATIKDWWWYSDASPDEPVPDHRLKRGDVVIEEGENVGAQFRSLQEPLDFYLNRGQLRRHQVRAGKKLYQLWRHGNMLSTFRVMRFEDVRGGHHDAQAKALLSPEYRKAMEAIRGERERAAAFAVCCEGKVVNSLDGFSSRRSAQRHGMKLLRDALDDLAYHFFTPPGSNSN